MTKGERDFNNFLLTPLDMPMEGKYHMPMIKGMVKKNSQHLPMRMGTALNFVQRDVTVLLELVD